MMGGIQNKRTGSMIRLAVFLGTLLLFFTGEIISGSVANANAYEAGTRTVKVGFFPMEGYHEKAQDGRYAGMDVEYLESLCEYVDWDIEYVECDSWDDALQMLSDKKVDLVGSAQYSQERARIYEYANLASGYTFGTVAVRGDSDVAYEDFEVMRELTYGVVDTYIRKVEFYEYMAAHGIPRPKVKEYPDTASLYAALEKGEIDALVHSLTEVRQGYRVVSRFAPMPFYYITYPGNDDVMQELNQGIADIKMNRPELENELMVKHYYSRLDQTILLTNEEKDYLKQKKTLTVGYFDGYYPFSFDHDGACGGLVAQVLDEVSASTGVLFDYVRVSDMQEAQRLLQEGAIDILSYYGDTPQSSKDTGSLLTKVYARTSRVIVMKKTNQADKIELLALSQDGGFSKDSHSGIIDADTKTEMYPSQFDCLYAINAGKADAAVCDGYLAEYLIGSMIGFGNMEIRSVLSEAHEIYMAVKKEENPLLRDILNKELIVVTDKMVTDYMLEDDFYSKLSLETYIREHSFIIITVLIVIALAVIFVLYRMLIDSRHIQRLMYRDPDLKIWNRNYFKYRASQTLPANKNAGYAVVYTMIRQYRRYNTLYGWQAGRRILELLIEVLMGELDKGRELLARSSGDHFILLVRYEDLGSLKARLANMEEKVSARIYEEVQIHMTLTMGVCCVPQGENDVESAITCAIQAVESVKDGYVSTVQIYDSRLQARLKERHEKEKLLELVDIQKDFVPFYQVKVDIRTGRVVGAEALVRFKDPTDHGAIKAPGYFVPYYEQTGKIIEIDFFVMECACKMLRKRLDEGREVVPVSCNFSRQHFTKEGFPQRFAAELEKYRIPKELIEVEITETIVVEELQRQKAKETVDALHRNGVHLSIDDFGSGYSSLGVFEQIPASVIKLDRSFLLNHENRARQVKIMKNIVNLARELDAQVVCEGVETEEDIKLMMEIGAYVAQGYLYSKPVPKEEFEELLEKSNA